MASRRDGALGADRRGGKTFESLLRRMKFCGGGRFLLARQGRARISPFSQITEQMLTQFRRRIGRYSVFRKCWLEYAMSEKFEAAAFLSSTRAETLGFAGPGPKFDERYPLAAVRRVLMFTNATLHCELKLNSAALTSLAKHTNLFEQRNYE